MSNLLESADREEFRPCPYQSGKLIHGHTAKTDAGREKRIARMVERLNKNLKPM